MGHFVTSDMYRLTQQPAVPMHLSQMRKLRPGEAKSFV